MSHFSQRTHPRTSLEATIQYAVWNSEQYRPGRMFNYSADGMCFECYETNQHLEPEAQVYVVMSNYAPGQFGPEGYRSYLTRVRWTDALSVPESDHFVAGAEIIACSHAMLTAEDQEMLQSCALCGRVMPLERLERIDENSHLCGSCRKQFQSLPQSKFRQCVERFFVENGLRSCRLH